MKWFVYLAMVVAVIWVIKSLFRRGGASTDDGPALLPKSADVARSFLLGVAGESHNNEDGSSRQKIIGKLGSGDPVLFIREPDNPHDPDAVAIHSDLGQIGYVPREHGRLAGDIDRGVRLSGAVESIHGGTRDKPMRGVVVRVNVHS